MQKGDAHPDAHSDGVEEPKDSENIPRRKHCIQALCAGLVRRACARLCALHGCAQMQLGFCASHGTTLLGCAQVHLLRCASIRGCADFCLTDVFHQIQYNF